jgi:hypothetical protein
VGVVSKPVPKSTSHEQVGRMGFGTMTGGGTMDARAAAMSESREYGQAPAETLAYQAAEKGLPFFTFRQPVVVLPPSRHNLWESIVKTKGFFSSLLWT